MDFSYPAEVEQFRKELRTWLAANLTDEVVAAGERRGRDPDAFEKLRSWDATLADAGWGAVSWPQEYGGRGATVLEQLAYAEETTRARAPMPLNVIGINNIAPAIMTYGTESQRRELLPRTVMTSISSSVTFALGRSTAIPSSGLSVTSGSTSKTAA